MVPDYSAWRTLTNKCQELREGSLGFFVGKLIAVVPVRNWRQICDSFTQCDVRSSRWPMSRMREGPPLPKRVWPITQISVQTDEEEAAAFLRHAEPGGIQQFRMQLVPGRGGPTLHVCSDGEVCA